MCLKECAADYLWNESQFGKQAKKLFWHHIENTGLIEILIGR